VKRRLGDQENLRTGSSEGQRAATSIGLVPVALALGGDGVSRGRGVSERRFPGRPWWPERAVMRLASGRQRRGVKGGSGRKHLRKEQGSRRMSSTAETPRWKGPGGNARMLAGNGHCFETEP
jgi:hypothetical protein